MIEAFRRLSPCISAHTHTQDDDADHIFQLINLKGISYFTGKGILIFSAQSFWHVIKIYCFRNIHVIITVCSSILIQHSRAHILEQHLKFKIVYKNWNWYWYFVFDLLLPPPFRAHAYCRPFFVDYENVLFAQETSICSQLIGCIDKVRETANKLRCISESVD